MAMPADPGPATPSGPPGDDPQAQSRGRCVYCGERCEAEATFHHFCRYEHEMEVAEKSAYAAAHPGGDGGD